MSASLRDAWVWSAEEKSGLEVWLWGLLTLDVLKPWE